MECRSCDVCGGISDASRFEVGQGTFFVLTRQPSRDPIEQLLNQGTPHQKYDLCPSCTAQFVALVEARRTLGV